jgi:hypothetical protein
MSRLFDVTGRVAFVSGGLQESDERWRSILPSMVQMLLQVVEHSTQ